MKKVYLETPEEVIKALKDGKVVYEENCPDYSFKLIENIIVAKYKDSFEVGSMVSIGNEPYVLEEEPFKLEVGKFYRTRNGSKAFVYAKEDKGKYNYWAVIVNSIIDKNFCCTVDGTYSVGKESKKDLVAHWEE